MLKSWKYDWIYLQPAYTIQMKLLWNNYLRYKHFSIIFCSWTYQQYDIYCKMRVENIYKSNI